MEKVIDLINTILIIIGIPAVIGAFIYVGRKLQILDDLKKTIEKVKYNVKVIADRLMKSSIEFDPSDLQNYSPVQLTESGLQRVKDVGFEEIFKNNKKDFFNFINTEEVKTKYDVEIAAIKSITGLFDGEYFNPLKSYLYKNSNVDEKFLRTTLGIYVRDKYLEAHPEIID